MNLASRLENLNKLYGTTILVSDLTRQAVDDAFEFRRIDRVTVKGRSQAVMIYELLGVKGAVPAAQLQLARLYEDALEHFEAGSLNDARSILEGLHDLDFAGKNLLARSKNES